MGSLKDKLHETLDGLVKVVKPRDKSNHGPYLFEIWIWQEISAYAKDRLEAAWKDARIQEVCPSDEDMRKKKGESIIVESDKFSCVTTVASESERFDKDLFIEAVAKKFKIKMAELEAIADTSKKKTAAALQKRVVEAA